MDFDLIIVIVIMAVAVALAIGLKVLIVLFAKKGLNIFSKRNKNNKEKK